MRYIIILTYRSPMFQEHVQHLLMVLVAAALKIKLAWIKDVKMNLEGVVSA